MKKEFFKPVTPNSYIKQLKQDKTITLILSVTRNCVLKCKYCYARDPFNKEANEIMSEQLLEKIIKDAFELRHNHINFEWTGGEALLAGRHFFEKVIELQKKHSHNNKTHDNCIQTSGGCYNEKLYDYLIDNKIRLSLTIDGPKDLHDLHRPAKSGAGSFDTVLRSRNYILKKQGDCGVLCTITRHSLDRVRDIINFYRQEGINWWFTNYYMYDPTKPVNDASIGLTNDEFARYFIEQHDYLIELDDPNLKPDYFMSNLKMLCGVQTHGKCSQGGRCLTNLIDIDNEGNVTPCARFIANKKYTFGNILEKPLRDLIGFRNPVVKKMVRERVDAINRCNQKRCIYLPLCNAGCPHDSFMGSGFKNVSGTDVMCEGKRKYFSHINSNLKAYRMPTITDVFIDVKGGENVTKNIQGDGRECATAQVQ